MLKVDNLGKRFGEQDAVRGISLDVERGESLGLLGPNGAGKSTTISMISGLIKSDSGDVWVDGVSVNQDLRRVKQKIGLVPQDIALYTTMSARENLIFWGRMYGLGGSQVKKRADEVLEIVGLSERGNEKIENYSGGMKRRINIGAALMHEPELLIMDEPTVGIDPQSRNHILETVKQLNREGMTVIYTSHYMEEVEYLCNRIAIIDHGQVIASGTKQELCYRLLGGAAVQVTVDAVSETLTDKLKALPLVQQIAVHEQQITIVAGDPRQVLADAVSVIVTEGQRIISLEVQEPNLETVFLQLTGRKLRD